MRQVILALVLFLSVSSVIADESNQAVAQAISESGAKSSDSLDRKISLLQSLFNDRHYLNAYAVDGSNQDMANAYRLNANRTPEQMISERIGGSCGTYARSFARLLKGLGVPSEDIRIVSTVCDEEYSKICPNGHGEQRDHSYRGSTGHVFVLLKVKEGNWKLINVAPAQTMDFFSPEELKNKLSQKKPVSVPEFEALPEVLPGASDNEPLHFRKMSVFDVSKPEEYPTHNLADRPNFIASGKLDNDVCRFDPSNITKKSDTSSATKSAK